MGGGGKGGRKERDALTKKIEMEIIYSNEVERYFRRGRISRAAVKKKRLRNPSRGMKPNVRDGWNSTHGKGG